MIISQEQLRIMLPTNVRYMEWLEPINEILPAYSIDTVRRVAGFMSQCAHESSNFVRLSENLNYSWSGLRKTFPKYFPTDDLARQYERQPERIANRVYANRMGNGPESSGDGWRYRGAGILQITGKNNYSRFAESIGYSLEEASEYIRTVSGSLESACWYWHTNRLNTFCDSEDLRGLTRAINGGFNGYDDRVQKYNKFIGILSFSKDRTMEY